MTPNTRPTLLIAVMLVLMLLATGWSTLGMLGQRAATHRAAQDLTMCRQLARQITELRDRGAFAADDGDSRLQQQQLAEDITAAAIKANLTGPWQGGIEHQRAVRIEDTPFLRKPAVLITRGLTLPQLAALVHHLTYDSPYTAEAIRMQTPSGEDEGDRWDAEVTLTYRIYSPIAAPESSGTQG